MGRSALEAQFKLVQDLRRGTYEPSLILPRRIVSIAMLGRGVARAGDRVRLGDKPVGFVTSGTVAPYWDFEGEGSNMRIEDTRCP